MFMVIVADRLPFALCQYRDRAICRGVFASGGCGFTRRASSAAIVVVVMLPMY